MNAISAIDAGAKETRFIPARDNTVSRKATGPHAERRAVTEALRVAKAQLTVEAAYGRLLEEWIFSTVPTPPIDRKTSLSYQRTLQDQEARRILTLLWKESPFVTDLDLDRTGLNKMFHNGLTQHGLAVMLADKPSDVAALNTRIRNIAIAGEAFGLVARVQHSLTRVYLEGTELLHAFMLRLAAESINALEA